MFSNELMVTWGFKPIHNAYYLSLKEQNPNLLPARVVNLSHDQFKVAILGEPTERWTKLRGQFYSQSDDFPIVGDWVVVNYLEGDHQFLPIEGILPRMSCLRRASHGGNKGNLVANIDFVGLVTSFNQDLNERRLERGVAMIEDSGSQPLIIINKNDLLNESEQELKIRDLKVRFNNIPIISCSAEKGSGIEQIITTLNPGTCIALLGMSGVGKSTLINRLMGKSIMPTTEIRTGDDRGRHTTTHRQMLQSDLGFWIIDSPGIREFSLAGEAAELDYSFNDITSLLTACRFRDCAHSGEPGCRVRQALESGELNADRWQNYLKLKSEVSFQNNKHN